jgi:hypothetical protein
MRTSIGSSKLYSVEDCVLTHLNKIGSPHGNLTFIEGNVHVPFDIQRVYYIYDVPAGSQRAGHAHRELFQLLIAASGSFEVHLDDSESQRTVLLNRPNIGLLITPMIWRVIDNFSPGAICLAIASGHYDESDYYRDYTDFLRVAAEARRIYSMNGHVAQEAQAES